MCRGETGRPQRRFAAGRSSRGAERAILPRSRPVRPARRRDIGRGASGRRAERPLSGAMAAGPPGGSVLSPLSRRLRHDRPCPAHGGLADRDFLQFRQPHLHLPALRRSARGDAAPRPSPGKLPVGPRAAQDARPCAQGKPPARRRTQDARQPARPRRAEGGRGAQACGPGTRRARNAGARTVARRPGSRLTTCPHGPRNGPGPCGTKGADPRARPRRPASRSGANRPGTGPSPSGAEDAHP